MKKVKVGDPLSIPAQTFNAFVDAARDFQSRQLQQSRAASQMARPSTILIKNTSTSARTRFDVLALGEPVILPADNPDEFAKRVAINGTIPTAETPPGSFAILLEPLVVNAIGQAQVMGICPAKVNFSTENDTRANIYSGYVKLYGGMDGPCEILWKEPGVGLKWAIVRLGFAADSPVFPARLVSTVADKTGWYNFQEFKLDANNNWTYGGRSGEVKEVNGRKDIAPSLFAWIHQSTNADGEKVYLCDGNALAGSYSSPYNLPPANSGGPPTWGPGQSPETVQEGQWPPMGGFPPGLDGSLNIIVQTRTAYNASGDQKLYAFYRTLTFDSTGRLVWVSSETRVTVDTPEWC